MDLHYKQEITVGALVLLGIVLFVGGTLWLSGRSFSPTDRAIVVQFEDIGTLKRGSPVKISGVELGTVEQIEFVEVGRVLVSLGLDERVQPRIDASARLASIGLVGDMVVEFNPGTADAPLPPGTVIRGEGATGLTQLGSQLAERASATLEGLNHLVSERMAEDLRQTLVSIQRLANTFADRRQGPTAELVATMTELRGLSARLDSVLASPAIDRSLVNLDTMTARLGRLSEQYTAIGSRVDSLLGAINRGEGTVGRLARDSTLFVEIRDLARTMQAFVDTLMRHPGRLTLQLRIF